MFTLSDSLQCLALYTVLTHFSKLPMRRPSRDGWWALAPASPLHGYASDQCNHLQPDLRSGLLASEMQQQSRSKTRLYFAQEKPEISTDWYVLDRALHQKKHTIPVVNCSIVRMLANLIDTLNEKQRPVKQGHRHRAKSRKKSIHTSS